MAFTEVHGITMAQNSFIENMVVETLTADPTVVEAGRIWFNSTEKQYKASSLNASGAVVVTILGSKEELDAYIARMASQAAGDGSALVGYPGHAGTNGQFTVAAGTGEATFDAVINGVDANTQAIADLGTGSLTNLQNEIDAVETGAGLETDGAYVANTSANYINTASSLKDADDKLDTEVKTLSDGLAQELVDRAAADDLKVNKSGDVMSGTLSMGDNIISNVANPVDPNDAANKIYVDTAVQGMDWKDSVVAATTSNVDLSTGGLSTVDGVVLQEGDRVLVKAQTTASENGLYVASAGAWVRTADADGNPSSEVSNGNAVFVEEGTANGGNGFILSTPDPITLGTTDLTYTQFSGAGEVIAGAGISKTGNELYLNFGAGIAELPNDEIGVEVSSTGSLFTTLDGSTASTDAAAKLAINLDGTTLTSSANGLKVTDSVIQDRVDAENAIQNELDVAETGAGLETDGTYAANTSANYIASASSLKNADTLLDAQIKANADDIAAAASNNSSANAAIQSELDAVEAGAGLDTDGTYITQTGANYINTASSLQDADSKLDAQVKVNADNITQEVTDRTTAINDLKTSINGNTFTYESGTAATSYTVTHNLASAFVTVALWIKQDDGTYKNDIAAVTLTSNNALTVDLTVAKNVRVVVTSPADV